MEKRLDPAVLGQYLLNTGFREWFVYLFEHINNTRFVVEPMHNDMFDEVHRIISGEDTRVNMNCCPRTAKTTFATWLCVYAILVNPKCQIIYTSFNQDLLKQVAQNIAMIMTHPIFKALYPVLQTQSDTIEEDPINEFWRDYIMRETGKPTFSSRRITTPQGGVLYFASIGSAITGMGAGVRNAKGFSGILIIDDGEKPTDIRSEVIRKKTQTYFAETLLSRLNNPDTPILNIQQRLHVDDLSNFLLENYGFKPFVFPLLDENGNCNLPSQYTPERIKELQVNAYVFAAQYQQQPQQLGGGVIKHDWWRYYADINDARYRRLFITADTASKTKEWNDYTAIGVWGVTHTGRLRLLDMVHAKMEIPELRQTFVALWDKWKGGIGTARCTAIYIEDKASGTQVIQELSRAGGMPIMPVKPEADKLTRVLNAVPQIVAGNVELPVNDKHPISAELLRETDAFSADFSHKHDDICDMICYAVDAAFNTRGYF